MLWGCTHTTPLSLKTSEGVCLILNAWGLLVNWPLGCAGSFPSIFDVSQIKKIQKADTAAPLCLPLFRCAPPSSLPMASEFTWKRYATLKNRPRANVIWHVSQQQPLKERTRSAVMLPADETGDTLIQPPLASTHTDHTPLGLPNQPALLRWHTSACFNSLLLIWVNTTVYEGWMWFRRWSRVNSLVCCSSCPPAWTLKPWLTWVGDFKLNQKAIQE